MVSISFFLIQEECVMVNDDYSKMDIIFLYYFFFWMVWEEYKSIEWNIVAVVFHIEGCLEKQTSHYLESKKVAECAAVTNLLRREYFAMLWEGYINHLPHNNEGPLKGH